MDHQAIAQLLGNYGEFVGAIAVFVTLFYLAVQVRQNTGQLKLDSFERSQLRHIELISYVLQDSETFNVFKRGLASYSSLQSDQQALFHTHLMRCLQLHGYNLQLMQAGALTSEEVALQRRNFARVFKCEGAEEWWRTLEWEPDSSEAIKALRDDILADCEAFALYQSLPFLQGASSKSF